MNRTDLVKTIDIGGPQYALLREGFIVQRVMEIGRTVIATAWIVRL